MNIRWEDLVLYIKHRDNIDKDIAEEIAYQIVYEYIEHANHVSMYATTFEILDDYMIPHYFDGVLHSKIIGIM